MPYGCRSGPLHIRAPWCLLGPQCPDQHLVRRPGPLHRSIAPFFEHVGAELSRSIYRARYRVMFDLGPRPCRLLNPA